MTRPVIPGEVSRVTDAPHEHHEAQYTPPQEWLDLRDEYLNRYDGRNTAGLDLDRIAAHHKAQKLEPAPRIFITPDDLDDVHRMEKYDVLKGVFKRGAHGIFSPEMGLSIIRRDPKMEAMNGTMFTEGLTIHEDRHGSAKRVPHTEYDGQKIVPQVGPSFIRPDHTSRGQLLRKGGVTSAEPITWPNTPKRDRWPGHCGHLVFIRCLMSR
jgi:hypothetical protein